MSNPSDQLNEDHADGYEMPDDLCVELPADIEDRRRRVMQLRLRRIPPVQIAAIVGITTRQVRDDIEAISRRRRAACGPHTVGFDPDEYVGETVDFYEELEQMMMMDASRLSEEGKNQNLSPILIAKQRAVCVRTAALMRQLAVAARQDHGLLKRKMGTLEMKLPRASEIRAAMQAIRAESRELMSPAERAWRVRTQRALDQVHVVESPAQEVTPADGPPEPV